MHNSLFFPLGLICIWLISILLRGRYTNIDNITSNAVTGSVFNAKRIRKFQHPYFETTATILKTPLPSQMCEHWGVVTTINAPTKSIHKIISQTNICLVIVADKKTPIEKYQKLETIKTIFLSVEKQEALKDWKILSKIPWNHFGRKNLGYLYAIYHGAKTIYDFDDDNELISSIPNFNNIFWEKVENTDVFNPYPLFISLNDVAWPRGFPLTQIQNTSTWNLTTKTIKSSNIGVIQSLANHDPDMDAIWRLTRKLPLYFKTNKRVVLPLGTYSSYNAQATLHYALWGTLLPVSVHGRVSDIWRSYIMQRLMHDLGLHVAFVSPFVNQIRNAHNYLGDYMSERPLYEKTEELIRILKEWSSTSKMFEQRMIELFVELYEYGFIQRSDVLLVQAWIQTLKQMQYTFPSII